jgi:diketogulonate reductase-like aldo/keto reductase
MPVESTANTSNFLYGTAWKEDRTASLTEMAIRAGFRGIDTANQRKHYFEAGVGDGLAAAYCTGIVKRTDMFLQTKYTSLGGQDHRLPYDPAAPPAAQVAQSLTSSLEHLQTDYLDSLVLHGPSSGRDWTNTDAEVWEAMIRERDAGRTRLVGVSNVSLRHLEQMSAKHSVMPSFVQNRCFARTGWDYHIRAFCRAAGITYQGFSLLTANVEVARHPAVLVPAERLNATPAQIIFGFARGIGMLPLTGTTDAQHMKEDLAGIDLTLTPAELHAIENIGAASGL